VNAESIFNKPVSKTAEGSAGSRGRKPAAKDDSGIDYSDIPALTNAQLAEFHRTPKVLVAA
jgi:hypothetical protein